MPTDPQPSPQPLPPQPRAEQAEAEVASLTQQLAEARRQIATLEADLRKIRS